LSGRDHGGQFGSRYDQAGYQNDSDSAWAASRCSGGRAEFFGSFWYNSAKARIQDFAYAAVRTRAARGLDYPSTQRSMSGFST